MSRTGRVLPTVVTVGLLMGLHLNTIRAELRNIRSNGREVAPAVAERDRPDDLLLVTPQWIASSFYYYYPGDTPGVDYPTEPFRGPIYYDDLKQRLLDPNRFDRLKARLTRAHRDGQRIWLVTERGLEPGGDLPESADLGTLPGLTTYHKVGEARARQLRAHLDELYGPPRTDAVPVDNRTGPEILDVYLYERKNR